MGSNPIQPIQFYKRRNQKQLKEEKQLTVKEQKQEELEIKRKEIDRLVAECEALAEEIKMCDLDPIQKYKDDISKHCMCIDEDNNLIEVDKICRGFEAYKKYPYYKYPSIEVGIMARVIKDLNDKMLVFKWCYDWDYTPDWKNDNQAKWFVFWDNSNERFNISYSVTLDYGVVYFSKEDIANKCAEWLNSLNKITKS